MTDRRTVSTITDTELDQLYAELAALRAVARGYCPACGRGDAAPTVEDWEQQKQRADQLEELLSIAHDTSNRSEAARARAEAALARVREIASELFMGGRTQTEREIGRRLSAALDRGQP